MMRALALAPIVVLAGVPVLMRPTAAFAGVGAAAMILCAAGVFLRWRPVVTAGASLALILYAVALVGSRSNLASAIVIGMSLALVLDAFEFARRFHGAVVTGPALRRQARHWVASVMLGVLVTTALAGAAVLVRISGPPALYPILAAVGALVAIAGIAGAFRSAKLATASADAGEQSDTNGRQAKEETSW